MEYDVGGPIIKMPIKLKDILEKVRKLTRNNIFIIKFTSLYLQCKKEY